MDKMKSPKSSTNYHAVSGQSKTAKRCGFFVALQKAHQDDDSFVCVLEATQSDNVHHAHTKGNDNE